MTMVEILKRTDGVPEKIESIIISAVEKTLELLDRSGDVTVAIVDNEQIRGMNAEYRDKDVPTDVLSFPAFEGFEIFVVPDEFLGDIAISYERAVEQARDYGHSVERETAFLAAHGTLHLLGYDHIHEEDEREMLNIQEKIMTEMGMLR